MVRQEFAFPSATGVCTISACAYLPGNDPDTVAVFHHGMAEHRGRYEAFASFLCDHGIAVYMHDMANHGKSNEKPEETGWFGETNGWRCLVQDYSTVVQRAAADYPGKKLIAMGHSLGSFVCRLYLAQAPEKQVSGAVLLGTGGANGAIGAGILTARMIAAAKGKKYKSPFLNRMAFGTYNKRFEGRTGYDWLTRDTAMVDRYLADPSCGFLLPVQGMEDLFQASRASNAGAWYESVPKNLPMLLMSGEEDPVGNYGTGVKNVAEGLKSTGHTRVTMKLYPECRHEVLNEINRREVMEDLLAWIRTVPELRERRG